MCSKPFITNHSQLFRDAIFDRRLVARTAWLNDALDADPDMRRRLHRNPYNAGSILVAMHMHQHACAVPSLRWDYFSPHLNCFWIEILLWSLSDFETTLLGMDGHINEENQRLNDDDDDAMECFWISELTAAITWVTATDGGTDLSAITGY